MQHARDYSPMNLERLHYSMLDNLSTAILLLDEGLNVNYVNSSAEMLLELSGPRVLGMSANKFFSENGKPLGGMINALETGNPYTKRQASLTLPSGTNITVDYTVTPITEQNATSLLLEFQPLDRLLKISREATLLSSQETSRQLIRGLAHEIKNPLGGLRGAAQLLARELPDESLKDYTDIIIAESDRLRNLVDRLLGSNKVIEHEDLNVHEVLEHVVGLVDAETGGSISFVRDYDPSIPNLSGDKGQLIQAVLNIIRNAMQSLTESDTGSPVIILRSRILRQFTIGEVRHRHVCAIEIVDNGPGIDPELIPTIFFPMVSGRAEGTGLGLSISQSVLNQHQGLIECSSKPGETRFILYLPIGPINE